MTEEERWERYWSDFRAMMGQPMAWDPRNFTDEEIAKLLRGSVESVDAMMTELTDRGYSVWFDSSKPAGQLVSGYPTRPLKIFIRKSVEL